jgi:3-keto-5-aminohexanoate cleavage enzyme
MPDLTQDAVTICAALVGNRRRSKQNPFHPETTSDIASEAKAAANAGAAIIHCHARTDDNMPTNDAIAYEKLAAAIAEQECNAVLNFSAGDVSGCSTHDERLGVIETGADIVSLGGGSFDCGPRLYDNSPQFRKQMHERAARTRVSIELELFDLGQIYAFAAACSDGRSSGAAFCNLVFGVPGGLPATIDLLNVAHRALPAHAHWTCVCITDDNKLHEKFMLKALSLGGNIRVGMEDCPFLTDGSPARSNAEIVAYWSDIVRDLGLRLNRPSDVRLHLNHNREG